MQADGTRIIFNRDLNNPSACSSPNPAHGQLTITGHGPEAVFMWRWPDGHTLRFDQHGRLVQIALATGEFVSLQRDGTGRLVQVTDPQGRQLRLQYADRRTGGNWFRGVTGSVSPVGTFSYVYGDALPGGAAPGAPSVTPNLAGVRFPDASTCHIY